MPTKPVSLQTKPFQIQTYYKHTCLYHIEKELQLEKRLDIPPDHRRSGTDMSNIAIAIVRGGVLAISIAIAIVQRVP